MLSVKFLPDMHELQIAQNIITIVNDELSKSGNLNAVDTVYFIAGRMRAIIPETLKFSYDVQKKNHTQLENSKLSVKEIDIVIKCKDCDYQQTILEPVFYCEKCLSTNIEIVNGNELYVDSIELAD
ncbi:MAG: hydrogenase maturation nickel metallochaperone HypA [Candidatus Marinimicrobia bacterium]|nr:hydrogenase maturation nickel metallochaperone HypA [Candidatus Neomarinimicrobiota bacterium]